MTSVSKSTVWRGAWRLTGIAGALLLGVVDAFAQPYAYVMAQLPAGANNRSTQVLTVIDIARRAPVARVPLGESCLCVGERAAVSADGTRVYVSNFFGNSVSVVDTATNNVVATYATSFPGAMAVSPDGRRLYVNAFASGATGYVVHVIDTSSGATVTTIPLNVPQSGSGMAISPNGARLYVTNQALNASNVKVIDTATLSVVATVNTGQVPRAIDISPDGQAAFIAVQNTGEVSMMSTATSTILGSVGVGTLPGDVRVTPNGARVYGTAQQRLTVMDAATGTAVATIPAVLPRALDFSPDGSTGVVAADGRVQFLDTATNTLVATLPFDPGTDGNPIYVVAPRSTPPPPDAPTGLGVFQISGNSVTLRWTPAATGASPSGFVIEGGLTPGSVLASVPTGSTRSSMTLTAPTGSFFVRVHAVGLGGRSPASNEIRLVVDAAVPPSPPANLIGTPYGSSVALAWQNTFEGGAPASLMLDVSGARAVQLPLGAAESFTFDGVPDGTYTFRVHAVSAAGAVGASSNAVTLTFPGTCTAAPDPPAGVTVYREGRLIGMRWQSPVAGAAPTSYVVRVTGAFVGNVTTLAKEVSGTVGSGTYTLRVAGVNACGVGVEAPAQTVTVP